MNMSTEIHFIRYSIRMRYLLTKRSCFYFVCSTWLSKGVHGLTRLAVDNFEITYVNWYDWHELISPKVRDKWTTRKLSFFFLVVSFHTLWPENRSNETDIWILHINFQWKMLLRGQKVIPKWFGKRITNTKMPFSMISSICVFFARKYFPMRLFSVLKSVHALLQMWGIVWYTL